MKKIWKRIKRMEPIELALLTAAVTVLITGFLTTEAPMKMIEACSPITAAIDTSE